MRMLVNELEKLQTIKKMDLRIALEGWLKKDEGDREEAMIMAGGGNEI